MRVRLLTSALNDLEAARYFYDKQGPEMGTYFFDSLFSDIDSLTLHGGIHSKIFDYHRSLARRFPYAIYYRIHDNNEAVVYRILDCRQEPIKTVRALKSGE